MLDLIIFTHFKMIDIVTQMFFSHTYMFVKGLVNWVNHKNDVEDSFEISKEFIGCN